MKLGIIIPTYDSLDTLKVVVKNIFDFTDGEYKVYIVEDGLRKDTVGWLKEQKGISVIYHEKNRGVSVSWNDGLREAINDGCTHFAIINDDIELPANWWNDCRKMFEEHDIHLLGLVDQIRDFTGWFFVLDKECVDKIGFFDEQFAPFCSEDDDYVERYRLSGMVRGKIDLKVFHHGSKTLKKIDQKFVSEVKNVNWHKFRKKYPNKLMQGL